MTCLSSVFGPLLLFIPLMSHGLNIIYMLTTLKFLSLEKTSFPDSRLVHPIVYSTSLLAYHKLKVPSSSPNLLHLQSLLSWLLALPLFQLLRPKIFGVTFQSKASEIHGSSNWKIQNPKISPHLHGCCPFTSHHPFSAWISSITLNSSPYTCPCPSILISQQRCEINSVKMLSQMLLFCMMTPFSTQTKSQSLYRGLRPHAICLLPFPFPL